MDSRPIVVTDAEFRMSWFRSAEAQEFACIGRVRGLTQVRPVGEQDWMPVQAFVEMEDGQLLDLGCARSARRARSGCAWWCASGRRADARTVGCTADCGACARGVRAMGAGGLAGACGSQRRGGRARLCPAHADRGELPDLKDPRHGAALRHSLTRKAPRTEVLILLLHALASVLAWRRGLLARQQQQDQQLLAHGQAIRHAATRATLSLWRIGWELLRRVAGRWMTPAIRPPR